jgi:hypothetical protein
MGLTSLLWNAKRGSLDAVGDHQCAVGIFMCPTAGAKSSGQTQFAPDIANRLRYRWTAKTPSAGDQAGRHAAVVTE